MAAILDEAGNSILDEAGNLIYDEAGPLVYTLFNQGTSGPVTADANAYTLGVQFTVSQAGATLTGILFYSPTGAVNLPGTIALFAVTGATLVHSEAATWSGAVGSGWVKASFTAPPVLTPGTKYKACVLNAAGTGNWYAGIAHYWDTGAGAAGITNGPLSAPNNAGGDGGQDTFTQSSTLTYPSSSFNAADYQVDPEVTTTALAAGTQQQQGGRSMFRRYLDLADL